MDTITVLKSQLANDSLQNELSLKGWNYLDGDALYTDFQFDISFENETKNNLHRSFQTHFTFNWHNMEIYLTLGLRTNNSWDDHQTILDDGRTFMDQVIEVISELEDNDYYRMLTLSFPSAHNRILKGIAALDVIFYRTDRMKKSFSALD